MISKHILYWVRKRNMEIKKKIFFSLISLIF